MRAGSGGCRLAARQIDEALQLCRDGLGLQAAHAGPPGVAAGNPQPGLQERARQAPGLADELDAKGEQFAIADPYQVAGTPVLYLVDANGKIAGSHLGRISEADLRAMITRMLEAK